VGWGAAYLSQALNYFGSRAKRWGVVGISFLEDCRRLAEGQKTNELGLLLEEEHVVRSRHRGKRLQALRLQAGLGMAKVEHQEVEQLQECFPLLLLLRAERLRGGGEPSGVALLAHCRVEGVGGMLD